MFLIPSKQIPTLFDASVVLRDFDLICERASQTLGIPIERLKDALKQSAEDELNHRLDQAIITYKQPSSKKVRCTIDGCIARKFKTEHYIDGNPYCSRHFKKAKTTNTPSTLQADAHSGASTLQAEAHSGASTLQASAHSGASTFTSLPVIEDIFQVPRPYRDIENDSFWIFSSFGASNEVPSERKFRFHRATQLVVSIHKKDSNEIDIELIGRYQNDTLVDKSLLDDYIIDWCIESGLTL